MQSVAACRNRWRQGACGALAAAGLPNGWGFRVSGTQTGDQTRNQAGDPTSRALARLEEAVERLAEAAAQPRQVAASGEGVSGEGVPRAAVAAIADRLDETIARLRAALGEDQ